MANDRSFCTTIERVIQRNGIIVENIPLTKKRDNFRLVIDENKDHRYSKD